VFYYFRNNRSQFLTLQDNQTLAFATPIKNYFSNIALTLPDYFKPYTYYQSHSQHLY